MSEPGIKRIEIVAAIVTILGALWYMLRGFLPSTLTNGAGVAASGNVTSSQPPTSIQSPMSLPISLTPGTGARVDPVIAGGAAWDESNPVKVNTISGDGTYPAIGDYNTVAPLSLTGNLPPSADVMKALQNYADGQAGGPGGPGGTGGAGGGCGCGCGNGGGQSKPCTNAPASATFPDGRGACLSSTPGTLTQSMEACSPGFNQKALDNMLSNTKYMSIVSNGSIPSFLSDVYNMNGFRPVENYDPGMVGLTTFV
jgi:hypothetical protein